LLAAIAASLLPAWSATRVDPLEAMGTVAKPSSPRMPFICAMVGILLVAVDPLIMFGPWERWFGGNAEDAISFARQAKFFGHFIAGLPAMMLGFFLLAPAFVWVLERVAGPIIAAMLSLRFAILRQQLTSGIWRVAGTCAALMVGLAILIAMETQGNTMLQGWRIPDKFPDIFIVSWMRGLDDEQIRKLGEIKGIKPGEVMPI